MSLNRLIREGLTPQTALSWPVFLLILAWNALANWLDGLQASNSEPFGRLAVIALVHLSYWAVLWLIVLTGKAVGWQVRGWSLLSVLLAVSVARGWAAYSLLKFFEIPVSAGLLVRILYSVFYIGLGIAVTALWIHQIRQHNQLLEDIHREQSRLLKVKGEAESKILEANQTLIKQIKNDLLARVSTVGMTNVKESLAELRDVIDHVVRPMSHHLSYKSEPWTPGPGPDRKAKVSWSRVIAESFSVENINPLATTVAVSILVAPSTIEYLSLTRSWLAVILAICFLFGWFVLYKKLAQLLVKTKERWAQTSVVLAGYFLAGLFTTLLVDLPIADDAPQRPAPIQILIYTLITGSAVSLAVQARRAMKTVESTLRETNAESVWEITRIRQVQRELEKELANRLHGKIQATMTAVYLKLNRSIEDNQLTALEIEESKELLAQSIAGLDHIAGRENKFDLVVSETVATWSGVCDISYLLSAEVHKVINQDALLSHSLEDLVPELAFNSVKHGRATKLDLSFELLEGRTLKLVASDNGTQLASSGRVGLGTKLLDDCCISWSRKPSDNGMVTVAELPVS